MIPRDTFVKLNNINVNDAIDHINVGEAIDHINEANHLKPFVKYEQKINLLVNDKKKSITAKPALQLQCLNIEQITLTLNSNFFDTTTVL